MICATTNMAIQVLVYTGHENTWIRKFRRYPLQWMWCDHYVGQGSKSIPFFQFTTNFGRHILGAQTDREPVAAKIWHTYHVPHANVDKF